MTQDLASEFVGVVVSWHSSQGKYWLAPRQVRKLGEDLSLSDYQEAAKIHPNPRQREKFETIAQWMKKQGAEEDTRLSAFM